MDSRIEQAVMRKHMGMNCAQAVAATYADFAGIDEATAIAMTKGLGTGIGGTLQGTCGAITGAITILGLIKQDSSRQEMYMLSADIVKKFQSRNSSVTCKDLKGIETGNILRACDDCVRDACEFLEEILK